MATSNPEVTRQLQQLNDQWIGPPRQLLVTEKCMKQSPCLEGPPASHSGPQAPSVHGLG